MMKRKMICLMTGAIALLLISACMPDDPTPDDGNSDCMRDSLASTVDAYFGALETNDPSSLPLAADVLYTENGELVEIGEGLWQTAGTVKLRRSALDTETCNTVTEAVITENNKDIVLGLRLKLSDGEISEIETIIARGFGSGSAYFLNAEGLLNTADQDWEGVLPAGSRSTRDELINVVDTYFERFPNGACNFADGCRRSENGLTLNCMTGMSCSDEQGAMGMSVRLHVIDEAAGIAVGFVKFAGMYTDFHMFKVEDGEVQNVHAVLSLATGTSIWRD
jgi:hypothetical protein